MSVKRIIAAKERRQDIAAFLARRNITATAKLIRRRCGGTKAQVISDLGYLAELGHITLQHATDWNPETESEVATVIAKPTLALRDLLHPRNPAKSA